MDATSIYYWTSDNWTPAGTGNELRKVALTGGIPIVLTSTDGAGRCDHSPIAVDGINAYWFDLSPDRIMKVPVDGGQSTTLATGPYTATALTVADGNLYWIDLLGHVLKMPVDGGTPTILSDGTPNSGPSIVADSESVYWLVGQSDKGALMNVPVGGGSATQLAENLYWPNAIAVDDSNIYWTDGGKGGGEGRIMKMPKHGGDPVVLALVQPPTFPRP